MARTLVRRAVLAALVTFLVGGTAALAANKTYKYRCTKCKLIQEYGQPGVKKCPNDGSTMIRQN